MTSRRPMILAVDDDPRMLKLLRRDLELEGYGVLTASDGCTGLQIIQDENPLLVILDIMLPGLDGFEVCERARQFSLVPIIMITAKGRMDDVVRGLNLGADDYIIKPFGMDEVVARIQAVLRRAKTREEQVQPPFEFDGLYVDFARHEVMLNGEEVMLTPTEHRILCLLARNAGKVITYDHLLTDIWGWEYHGDVHVVQAAVNRLRTKIGDTACISRYITTRSGIGYAFRQPRSPARQPQPEHEIGRSRTVATDEPELSTYQEWASFPSGSGSVRTRGDEHYMVKACDLRCSC